MEQLSFTYSDNQSVNYLDQTHKWIDNNVISSNREVCKQLDICQEKLREEHEQKRQEKFSESSLHSQQLSQEVAQQLQQSQNISCVRKGNKLDFQKTLKCSLYQRKNVDSELTPMNPSSYRILRKRRNYRQIRHTNIYTLRQSSDPFARQIFNGSNFY